jgi:hypothetical protein
MKPVTECSISELENLVANHRRLRATDRPIFAEALRELELRKRGFDFHKSMALILAAARERQYICCKDLADANDLEWSQVYRRVGAHLGAIAEWSTSRCGLMLDSIVVNKPNVATGRYEPEMLKGFVGWARELGYTVTDEEAFLCEQQERVFAWAKNNKVQRFGSGEFSERERYWADDPTRAS